MDLQQLVLLGILSSSIHWIIARSKIAKPLWSRAKGWLADLLACPACFGFWIGIFLGLGGVQPYPGYVSVTAVLAVFLTPVFEGALLWGLEVSSMSTTTEDKVAEAVTQVHDFYAAHLAAFSGTLAAVLRNHGVDSDTVKHVVALLNVEPPKEPDA